jgi:hypothetical protein
VVDANAWMDDWRDDVGRGQWMKIAASATAALALGLSIIAARSSRKK